MPPVVVGLDVGTTGAKAVAFDPDGRVHGAGRRTYPLGEPVPGAAVQDAETVAAGALEAAAEAVAAARAAGAEVRALALSGAMHSLLALDADDRPLGPALTWADGRAADQAERLREEAGAEELAARTGAPLHASSPLAKLVRLREREPALFAAARRWVGLKEWVLARLTGEWAMDVSVASGTGLLDVGRLDWDPEALDRAGVGADRLAPLVEPTTTFALRAGLEGLPAGTPVVAGAGDGPLANLGVGATRPGVAACSIGTSGALRVTVEAPAAAAGRTFCHVLVPGRWVVGGAVNNGGSVLAWAREALGAGAEIPELLAEAATVPAGADGLLMLPYLLAERAPRWSRLPRGAYVGLARHHRRAHLVRAALEGVCLQLALVLGAVREAGDEVREIRATGGFARSELWRGMLASALAMPLGFPADPEGSSLGAALLGMQALGLVDALARAPELVPVAETVPPDPADAAVYADLLPAFAGLFDALTPAWAALGQLAPTS